MINLKSSTRLIRFRGMKCKNTLLILLLFSMVVSCIQKHITKQSEITTTVTVCDKFYGDLHKSELISKPYLSLNNNTPKWRIISYEFSFITKPGYLQCYTLRKDTFSKELIFYLDSMHVGSKLFIDNI